MADMKNRAGEVFVGRGDFSDTAIDAHGVT
jgi:hypothetical protein